MPVASALLLSLGLKSWSGKLWLITMSPCSTEIIESESLFFFSQSIMSFDIWSLKMLPLSSPSPPVSLCSIVDGICSESGKMPDPSVMRSATCTAASLSAKNMAVPAKNPARRVNASSIFSIT